MSVKLMILGILHDGHEAHGYTILQKLKSWQAETWTSIKPGSVYHALGQFEKHHLAENTGSKQGGGPAATGYKITQAGKQELYGLIEEALISYDQEEFAAGLAWMHLLPRKKVIELAKQRLEAYHEINAFMTSLPRNDTPEIPSENPEIIGSWQAIFVATTKWQEGFLKRLENGSYKFKND